MIAYAALNFQQFTKVEITLKKLNPNTISYFENFSLQPTKPVDFQIETKIDLSEENSKIEKVVSFKIGDLKKEIEKFAKDSHKSILSKIPDLEPQVEKYSKELEVSSVKGDFKVIHHSQDPLANNIDKELKVFETITDKLGGIHNSSNKLKIWAERIEKEKDIIPRLERLENIQIESIVEKGKNKFEEEVNKLKNLYENEVELQKELTKHELDSQIEVIDKLYSDIENKISKLN